MWKIQRLFCGSRRWLEDREGVWNGRMGKMLYDAIKIVFISFRSALCLEVSLSLTFIVIILHWEFTEFSYLSQQWNSLYVHGALKTKKRMKKKSEILSFDQQHSNIVWKSWKTWRILLSLAIVSTQLLLFSSCVRSARKTEATRKINCESVT